MRVLHAVGLLCAVVCAVMADVAGGEDAAAEADEVIPEVGYDPTMKDAIQLTLGEKKRLDALGPLIINKDGTTKRVTNWDKMTDMEREGAFNRIVKRNRERMAVLKQRLEDENAAAAAAAAAKTNEDLDL